MQSQARVWENLANSENIETLKPGQVTMDARRPLESINTFIRNATGVVYDRSRDVDTILCKTTSQGMNDY